MTTSILSVSNWLRRRTLSKHERQLLKELSNELDQVELKVPMQNSYKRLSPYIIEASQGEIDYKFIIYHIESKLWFDNAHIDSSIGVAAREGLVNSGDTVFDLGCNSGYITSWFAKRVGPTGRVVAFDPFPWNTVATKYSALLNDCENVECHTVGIAANHQTLRIPVCDSKIYANDAVPDSHLFDAQLVPLDDYASYKPDYIKVDIEGAERDLLRGASKILNQSPKPIWFIEMHHDFIEAAGHDPNQIGIDFRSAGYDCRISSPNGEAFQPAVPMPRGCGFYALPRNT